MIDINDYKEIYKRNIISMTRIWLFILFLIIIGIFLINKSFKYKEYYDSRGEYRDNYINIYVLIDDIKLISSKKELIINDKIFAYKIEEISSDNIYMNNNYYKEVKIDIDKKFKENEIINIEIIIEEKTLLNYVFETVWR